MRFLIACLALLVAASPAHAGPLGAVAAWVGSTLAAGGFGAVLLRVGLTIAVTALSRAVQAQQQPGEPKAPGIGSEYSYGEGIPPKVVLGMAAVRGHSTGPAYSHGGNNTPNRHMVRPTILSDMPITSLDEIIIDGDIHTLDPASPPPTGSETNGGRVIGKWRDSFQIKALKLGPNASTADFMMTKYAGHPERPWTADMIGRDIAWIVPEMETDLNGEQFTSEVFPLYVVKGAPLYDRRTEATAYTENPVVMIEAILRGAIAIPGVGTWGMNADEEDLPDSGGWSASMDVCDEDAGGRPRYRAGLELSLDNEPLTVIGELLKACGGDIADCGGTWLITAGPPPTSVYSFTDLDVLSTEGRQFDPFPGLADTFNGVAATYPDPRNAWQETSAVPYHRSDWEQTDGGRRLVAEVQFPTVPYPEQVRQLMREMAADNRRFRSHELTLPPPGAHVMPLNTVTMSSTENGYVGKLFEVRSKTLDPFTLNSRLAIRERDPSDYDPDLASDETLPDPPSRIGDDRTIYGVEGWDVEGVTIALGAGEVGSDVPAAHCVWTADAGALDIEVRLAATGQIIGDGRFSGGRKEARIQLPLFAGRQIEARGKIAAAGRPTTWSPWVLTELPGNFITYGSLSDQIKADFEAGKAEVLNATRVARGLPRIDTLYEGPLPAGTAGQLLYRARDESGDADGTLYKFVGGAWTTVVPEVDITGIFGDELINGVSADKLIGQITQTQITDGSISTSKIAANAILAGKIATGAITADKIATNAVTAGKIAADAVVAGTVAAGAVRAGELAANAVQAVNIAANSVTADKANFSSLAALGLSVVTADIVNANITRLKIAGQAIDTDRLGVSAVSNAVSSYVEGPTSTSIYLPSVPSNSYVLIVVAIEFAGGADPDSWAEFVVTGASATFSGRRYGYHSGEHFFASEVRGIGTGNRTLTVNVGAGFNDIENIQLSAILLKA